MSTNPYQPPTTEPAASVSPTESVWHPRRWMIIMPCLGLILGATSRLLRPSVQASVHWDAVVSLVLLVLISLLLLKRCYRTRFINAAGYYLSGSVSLWTAFVVGWCFVAGTVFQSLVETAALWWFGLAMFGLIVLGIPHRVKEAKEV